MARSLTSTSGVWTAAWRSASSVEPAVTTSAPARSRRVATMSRVSGHGEDHHERRAATGAVALGADGPAVGLDDVAHDREAQAEAAVAPGDRAVGLAKAVEDVRRDVGRQPLPGVADAEPETIA